MSRVIFLRDILFNLLLNFKLSNIIFFWCFFFFFLRWLNYIIKKVKAIFYRFRFIFKCEIKSFDSFFYFLIQDLHILLFYFNWFLFQCILGFFSIEVLEEVELMVIITLLSIFVIFELFMNCRFRFHIIKKGMLLPMI